MNIYHDNGAAFGRRTRYFRNAAGGGVEWMYAVDYANGSDRWYGYLSTGGHETIGSLDASGMVLLPVEVTDKPANGFDTRVLIDMTTPAWARFTDDDDYVETVQIRKGGDFGGLIRSVHRSRVTPEEEI